MSHPLPPKKEVALALLERSKVSVHLDPRKSGVAVPVHFRKQPQLVLDIGLNMPVPIPDLRLDEEGMTCTLSFSRQPFYCIIPWTSIFAMVGDDGFGMVWPEDVPPEIAQQTQRPAEQPAPRARPQAAKRALEPVPSAKRALEAVPAKRALEPVPDAPAAAASGKPAKKSRSKKPRIAVVEPPPAERPVLVALPAPPEPRGPRPVPSPKKRAPDPRPKPGAGAGKKRELPPYLRVVK